MLSDGCSHETVQIPANTKTHLNVTVCDKVLRYQAGNQMAACPLGGSLVDSQTAQNLEFSGATGAAACNVAVDSFELYKRIESQG